MKFWAEILWLVDQAQHSKNGRKSWLARISSVKRQPSGNSASSISCSSDRTMEFTLPKKIPLPPTWIWTETPPRSARRSEEHTSELQSHLNLVCRLLLE